MSTLPDLDTSTVGFIAYWNAIDDGGVGSIEASDCLSDGSIQEYTLYDNGFTAQYTLTTGRTATVRVKQDGWFVAYIDRSSDLSTNQSDPVRGPWDVINDWTDDNSTANGPQNNSLERSINSLKNNLSNSGSITYNPGDVGLYSYNNPNATTATLLSANISDARGSTTYGFLYTSDTDRHYQIATGSSYTSSDQYDSSSAKIAGTTLADTSSTSIGRAYGAIDIIGSGIAPDPGTEYQSTLYADSNMGPSNTSLNILTLWSST